MKLDEAKDYLNSNGYILVETSTYKGHPFLRILWEKLLYLDDEERKLNTHSNNPDKWIDIDFEGGSLRIYRTNIGIRGEFDTGRKFTYKTTGQNKWDAATECAKFIISAVNGEIYDRKSSDRLKNGIKESKQYLNSKGYILEDTLNERLNMNQVVGMINDLEKQHAIILYDMIDPKIAELYLTRSQYDAITVFEEFKELAKLKKKWGVTKGLGDEDLRTLDVNGKKLIKGYIDKNLPVWKITIYF